VRKFLTLGVATALLAALAVTGISRAADEKEKPKYTIKQVMKEQGKLRPKIIKGEATKEDKEKMLTLYEALPGLKPPMGSEESWKKLTETLVAATKDVVEDKEGAIKAFDKASNCMACHSAHKPKST